VTAEEITAVILAGGRARRMGGEDKGLVLLEGREMVARVIERLAPQAGALLINANRNREAYERFGHPVLADAIDGYCGPLAGMLSGMEAARTDYVLTAPCDAPFLPRDLAARLGEALARERAEIAVAHTGERMQPVFALLERRLRSSARAYLESGERKIDTWFARHRLALADFSDAPQTFVNVNTPEEVSAAARALAGVRG